MYRGSGVAGLEADRHCFLSDTIRKCWGRYSRLYVDEFALEALDRCVEQAGIVSDDIRSMEGILLG